MKLTTLKAELKKINLKDADLDFLKHKKAIFMVKMFKWEKFF